MDIMTNMLHWVCSPLYELNGGRVNPLGIGARSISSENSDRATLRRARLMASIAAL